MLKTVLANLTRAVRTRAPDDMPPLPPVFRGMLQHDPALCTGCHTCSFVCAPKAIRFEEEGEQTVTWSFYAGGCSFCGLCARFCPTGAITNRGAPPQVTTEPQEHHHLVSVIPRQPCVRCGKLYMPLPELDASRLAGAVPSDGGLCESCRRRLSSEKLRDAFIAPENAKGTRS